MKEIFSQIYKTNLWGSKETVSGAGSELKSTITLRKELPILFKKYNIKKALDLGCGDFNWINKIVNCFDYYLGIDVVPEIIEKNNRNYQKNNINFKECDIQSIDLNSYQFDVIIMSDVLVHHSFSDIFLVLDKICNSNIKYILMTHFTKLEKNSDIKTGNWRTLNWTIEPFNMKLPLESISYNELYDIGFGICNDKTLSLWSIKNLKNKIPNLS